MINNNKNNKNDKSKYNLKLIFIILIKKQINNIFYIINSFIFKLNYY